MPEFRLNDANKGRAYAKLDSFAKGYIEAMFFTNGDTGDEQEHSLNELGTERLTNRAIASIAADCSKFLGTILHDGCFVRQWLDRAEDYTDEQAGRDLWFTRQGHGVGYWERKQLAGELG